MISPCCRPGLTHKLQICLTHMSGPRLTLFEQVSIVGMRTRASAFGTVTLSEADVEAGDQYGHLGKEHPDTLTSIAHVAAIYEQQWRLEEAEELKLQVLETGKQLLGDEHPDTLTSMANLAMNCRHQGRENEAECLEIL